MAPWLLQFCFNNYTVIPLWPIVSKYYEQTKRFPFSVITFSLILKSKQFQIQKRPLHPRKVLHLQKVKIFKVRYVTAR